MYNDPNQPNPPPPYEQIPYTGAPQGPYGSPQGPGPYGVPPQPGPYGAPPPGYIVQPPPQRSSRRWLWITLSIIGGIIILSCIGCTVAGVFGANYFGSLVGPTVTVTRYYQAIQLQDYAQAYSQLDTTNASIQGQSVTLDSFTQLAQNADNQKGTVARYTPNNINTQGDTADITVQVTRGGSTYPVHMQLKNVNNVWKITSADDI